MTLGWLQVFHLGSSTHAYSVYGKERAELDLESYALFCPVLLACS